MNAPADVDIAICTFQRDHVCQTLNSVAEIQVPDGLRVRVIVADNDDTPSARDKVMACKLPFPLKYVHAPGRNISIARNACLDAVTAPRLVFIDDDELVSPGWLEALLAEQNASGAEIVLGPALAVYPPDTPDWMRAGDHHSSRPVYVNGDIVTGYGCNTLLMRTAPSVAGLRFRSDLGRSGGEDTIFLATVYRHGGRISYAPGGIVTEEVPPNRARLGWLLKRKYRFGQTHGEMLLEDMPRSSIYYIQEISGAGLKSIACLGMAVLTAPVPSKGIPWLLRGALHAGVVSRFLGGSMIEAYGRDQPS